MANTKIEINCATGSKKFVNKTDAEIAEKQNSLKVKLTENNRHNRNVLLQETDYLALADHTLSSAMTVYRQALRDLPDHSNWPNLESDDWPTKP